MTGAPARDAAGAPLGNAAARGVVLMVAQNLVGRALTFGNQIVLAWLLTPADFGVVALALGVAAVAEMIVTLGIDDVVIQRGGRMRHWLAPGFRLGIVTAVAVATAIAVIAPAAAALFAQPMLGGLLPVLALGLPFSAAALMPAAKLRSDLRFKEVAGVAAGEVVLIQGLSLALAFAGAGAWSLVVPLPLAATLRAGLFTWLAPFRRRRPFSRRRAAYLMRHGSVVLGTRLMTTLLSYGDALVLGLAAPPASVGAYFFAAKVAAQPIALLAANITNVLFPTLTRLGADPARQREAAMAAIRILAYAVLPCSFLQAAIAEPLMRVALGPRWAEAIVPVQLLSVGLGFNALLWIAGAFMSARREFGRIFGYAISNATLFLLAVALGAALDGSRGTAAGACLFYAIACPIELLLVFRSRDRWRDLRDVVLRPTLLAGTAALLANGLVRIGPDGLLAVPWAMAAALVALATFAALLRLTDRSTWSDLRHRLLTRRSA